MTFAGLLFWMSRLQYAGQRQSWICLTRIQKWTVCVCVSEREDGVGGGGGGGVEERDLITRTPN